MERAYDEPFDGVRVHDDSRADLLAHSMGADAFTAGNDLFFRSGRYRPDTGTGQQLLAHELAHVVQQESSGVDRGALPIGRKIGFEFEFSNWQTAESKASNFAAATDTTPPNPTLHTMTTMWRRIDKGKALVQGQGFELQADDDPNDAAKSDLEVVTDPFEESPAGRGELRAAMAGVQGTLQGVTNNFNAWWAAGHVPRAIDLQGAAVRQNSFIFSLNPHFRAKPQATIGLRLEKVADLLEDMFPVGAKAVGGGVAGEAGATSTARHQGRLELTGWDSSAGGPVPGQILRVQGEAPAQARLAIANYRAVPANNGAPAATDGLTGLLSLVIAYLRMADQSLVRSYAKTVAPVMARTDFAALFRLLSPAERAWYKPNGGQAFFDLVQQAPWLNGMNAGDEVFSQGVQNPVLGVGQAQGLTRGKWLKGIAKGTDYLTGKKFPDKAQRGDIEGLGSYGKKTDSLDLGVGQTAKAAILELRAMPQTDITLLPAVADRLFLYSYLANRGGPEKYGQATIPF